MVRYIWFIASAAVAAAAYVWHNYRQERDFQAMLAFERHVTWLKMLVNRQAPDFQWLRLTSQEATAVSSRYGCEIRVSADTVELLWFAAPGPRPLNRQYTYTGLTSVDELAIWEAIETQIVSSANPTS